MGEKLIFLMENEIALYLFINLELKINDIFQK